VRRRSFLIIGGITESDWSDKEERTLLFFCSLLMVVEREDKEKEDE